MRVVAILAVRNEQMYLANCLRQLIENGPDYSIIDNDSDDGTRDLFTRPEFSKHLVKLEHHPLNGSFGWAGLMRARKSAARDADAE